ncbi:PadR family transcriptional regulator [Fervidobacterium thailandense]|uniref:PadR family transcriptional regulator n=1 Tax=Fervidobacterium thailandense TaxID=1008305 RepID=A0A1E3G4F2_9BACT|nr:PadR family transcriptional regulator [Fervidobacterium thailandense]ODN31155.1 PadR family transcriptional regulator [Fervidobacterium thailandense]
MRRKCGCRHGFAGGFHRCEETGFTTGDFLVAVLMKMLKERPMHGYELVERLSKIDYYPFPHDPSVVYGVLRKLEAHGLLTYTVEEGNGGLRKIYKLTPDGERFLEEMVGFIRRLKGYFEEFLRSERSELKQDV